MNTTTVPADSSQSAQSRIMQLGFAGLLGLFVVGFVGFAHMDIAHNAAHDYRHSMAFPCH